MRVIITLLAATFMGMAQPATAYNQCTTDTYTIDGRTIMCTTCCTQYGCNTFC